MRLALATAWIGFAAGVLCALGFAVWSVSFLAHTCVFCFGFDFDVTPAFVAVMVAAFGLMNGSVYGLVGFAIGYITEKARTTHA